MKPTERGFWTFMLVVIGASYIAVSIYNKYFPAEPAYLEQARDAAERKRRAVGKLLPGDVPIIDDRQIAVWRTEAQLALQIKAPGARDRVRYLAELGDEWALEMIRDEFDEAVQE